MNRLFIPLLALAVAALPADELRAADGETGYVVRSEPGKVYLDLGKPSGISVGRTFVVYREGEELKHPVTGGSLGLIEVTAAHGTVTEVREKYSIGRLDEPEAAVEAGMRLRLLDAEPPPPAPATAPAASAAAQAPAADEHAPYFRSPVLDLLAVDIAIGDTDGDGAREAILASQREIRAYPIRQTGGRWEPSCVFREDQTGARFFSVEAADLDGDGRDEVFATFHSSFFKRVESHVLDCKAGVFTVVKTIPWMVRSFQEPDGRWALGAQQMIADKSFPSSNIYRLEYREGRHVPSKERIKHKRLEWLYGFGFARRADPSGEGASPDPFLLYYQDSGRIRAQFKKEAWTSRDEFGQTSERLVWHDNKLGFYPRFVVESTPKGLTGLYSVKNIAPLFNLASPFGIYRSSELHFLRWNGMALEPAWKTELSGYAAGMAEYGAGPTASLLIPVRGVEDNTSVWFFRK